MRDLNVQIGQRWATRGGIEIAKITGVEPRDSWPISATIEGTGTQRTYRMTGVNAGNGPNHTDLITQITEEPMDNISRMEAEAKALRESLNRLDKEIAEAKKPKHAPLRHGDIFKIENNKTRLIVMVGSSLRAFDENGHETLPNVREEDYVIRNERINAFCGEK